MHRKDHKRRRSTKYYKKVVYPVKIFYEESSIVTCETIKVFKITSAKIIGLSLWEAKGSGSKNKKYIHHPTRKATTKCCLKGRWAILQTQKLRSQHRHCWPEWAFKVEICWQNSAPEVGVYSKVDNKKLLAGKHIRIRIVLWASRVLYACNIQFYSFLQTLKQSGCWWYFSLAKVWSAFRLFRKEFDNKTWRLIHAKKQSSVILALPSASFFLLVRKIF